MTTTNGTSGDGHAKGKGKGQIPPEYIIAKTLHQKLEKDGALRSGDREEIAYRISEIMVCAKDLYTVTLPRLMGEGESLPFNEELAGLRMSLLHIRDLVADFDSSFLDAMLHEREGQPTESEWLNPDNWESEELGEGEASNYEDNLDDR